MVTSLYRGEYEPARDRLGPFVKKSRGGSNGRSSAIKIEEKKRKTDILLV